MSKNACDMKETKELKPKKCPGFHFYPYKRKKKRFHSQFVNMDRVLEQWGFVPRLYYVFFIKDRYYACLPDANFIGNVRVGDEYFRPVIELPDFEHGSGCVVYGYVGVVQYSSMGILKGRFVFVKNDMNIGLDLTRALSFKSEIHFEKYKKFEIWKKK